MPAPAIAETFVQEGFTAVRITISKVIARSGLGWCSPGRGSGA